MADDTPTRPTPRSIMSAVSNSAAPSAVVPVLPDDQLNAVAGKVRQTGASQVQLLIPAGAVGLRSARSFRALRVLLRDQGVQLLVVSGDPATLAAAREADIDTLGLDAPVAAPRASRPGTGAPQAIDANDAAFLRNLDQVDDQDAAVSEAPDLDQYGMLDDVPGVEPEQRAAPPVAPRLPRPLPEDAIRRLSGDTSPDLVRPRPRPRPERVSQSTYADRAPVAPVAVPRRDPRTVPLDDEEYDAPPRRRSISPNLVALLVIAALLLAGAAWALANRVTVVITPPVGDARQIPFESRIIPIDRAPSAESATAVQALPVAAEAEFTLTGQVQAETVSPVGRAQGQVRIVNTIEQPVPLPEGTELVGQNADGADVRFVLDQPTTVPPAVTTATETGRSTTYGETTVSVTARSPGSASNVGANAIKQVVIPGQQPLVSDRSNFLLRHEAIGGGTEEPQRIVTEAEVQRVLGDALTNLYNSGLQALEAEASSQGLAADPSTVTPNITQLGRPEAYDPPVVSPPVGSAVDVSNPSFTVTVRTRFNALAAPADRPVAEQLETVVPQFFSQSTTPPCSAGESQAVKNVSWSWNGERLAIDGVVECTPLSTVAPERVAAVRAALVGQSRETAAATLDQYRQQGLIGGYELPDRGELPPFEILIDVEVAEPAAGP